MKGLKSVLARVCPFYFFYSHNLFLGAYASKMLALYNPEELIKSSQGCLCLARDGLVISGIVSLDAALLMNTQEEGLSQLHTSKEGSMSSLLTARVGASALNVSISRMCVLSVYTNKVSCDP